MTNLLKETRKLACKLASTPINPNHKLGEAKEGATVNREMSCRETHLSLSHKITYSICCECY